MSNGREYDVAQVGDRYAVLYRDRGAFWVAMYFVLEKEEAVDLVNACRMATYGGQRVAKILPAGQPAKRLKMEIHAWPATVELAPLPSLQKLRVKVLSVKKPLPPSSLIE